MRTRTLFSRVTPRKALKYHSFVFGVVARGGHFRRVSEAGTRLRPPSDRAFNILPRWPPGGAGAHPPRHTFQFITGASRGRNACWQYPPRKLCGIAWLLQFLAPPGGHRGRMLKARSPATRRRVPASDTLRKWPPRPPRAATQKQKNDI